MRFIFVVLLSLFVTVSSPVSAGLIDTGAKAYTAYRLVKIGATVLKYGRQLQSISKIPLNSRQLSLLKGCFQDRNCASYVSNPKTWNKPVKDALIREWEAQTGLPWPKHSKTIYSKHGRILAEAGSPYEAHHIIPKSIGGPHSWWNMHPVPRPEHQSVVHAGTSFLNEIMKLAR
ncbi:HNH endonuclease signature motif containing protein [Rhizobium sp. MHM7A]|uniref:HNH endonuclease signature motif containing protein n=1 Tax=Rhizobium sp. MHM7A TaxID=2583233 RepID=UPI001106FB8E|nr:HNH endonuclease signature motif containing protein [Rhizobium sp. MHM7A]TLX17118.1 HNH endonuclease [Rhizobium sp. MHM7A]